MPLPRDWKCTVNATRHPIGPNVSTLWNKPCKLPCEQDLIIIVVKIREFELPQSCDH